MVCKVALQLATIMLKISVGSVCADRALRTEPPLWTAFHRGARTCDDHTQNEQVHLSLLRMLSEDLSMAPDLGFVHSFEVPTQN